MVQTEQEETRWKSSFHKSDKGANQILVYTTKLGLLRSFNFNKNGSYYYLGNTVVASNYPTMR